MGAAGLVALLPALAGAEQATASFRVSVVVPSHATLTVLEQPSRFTVSADDVERGYADVSVRYRVSHNDPRGYLLRLAPRPGGDWRVAVQGLSGEVVLEDQDIELMQAGAAGRQDFALGFRVLLDDSTRPGTYAMPVLITATPL